MSDLGAGFGLLNPAGYANAAQGISAYSDLGAPYAQLLLDDFQPSGDPQDIDQWNDTSGNARHFNWGDGQSWTPECSSTTTPVSGMRTANYYAANQGVGYDPGIGSFQWELMTVGIAFRFNTAAISGKLFCITNHFSRGCTLWAQSGTNWGVYADLRPVGAGATNVYYPAKSTDPLTDETWLRVWFKKKATGLDIWLGGTKLTLDTTVINDADTLGVDETWWLDNLETSVRCEGMSVGAWIEEDATPSLTWGMSGQVAECVVWNAELTDEQIAQGDTFMAQRLEL